MLHKQILFATNNPGKLIEISKLLGALQYRVISLADLGGFQAQEVEETGSTFRENALLKAAFFGQLSKLPTVADDSGLLVHCLDGFPGVNSNRWFKGSDSARCEALLKKMSDKNERSATFVTVICFFEPLSGLVKYFEGRIGGQIAKTRAGDEGFGYDPLFIPQGYQQTFAQLGIAVKNQISHRAIAMQKLLTFLETYSLEIDNK